MRLWIWSDLHLELQAPTVLDRVPEADAIVCAGDLCLSDQLEDCARSLVERYGLPVVFVPGHEFYSGGVSPQRTKSADHLLIKEVAEASRSWRQRFHVLDGGVIELDGVRFIGGTLRTDFMMDLKDDEDFVWRMESAPSQLADFSRIWLGTGRRLTPGDMTNCHRSTRGFIERQLAIPFEGKTIVVTHHMPHLDCTPAAYRDWGTNYLFACGKGAFEESSILTQRLPSGSADTRTTPTMFRSAGAASYVIRWAISGFLPSAPNGFHWDFVIDTENLP